VLDFGHDVTVKLEASLRLTIKGFPETSVAQLTEPRDATSYNLCILTSLCACPNLQLYQHVRNLESQNSPTELQERLAAYGARIQQLEQDKRQMERTQEHHTAEVSEQLTRKVVMMESELKSTQKLLTQTEREKTQIHAEVKRLRKRLTELANRNAEHSRQPNSEPKWVP